MLRILASFILFHFRNYRNSLYSILHHPILFFDYWFFIAGKFSSFIYYPILLYITFCNYLLLYCFLRSFINPILFYITVLLHGIIYYAILFFTALLPSLIIYYSILCFTIILHSSLIYYFTLSSITFILFSSFYQIASINCYHKSLLEFPKIPFYLRVKKFNCTKNRTPKSSLDARSEHVEQSSKQASNRYTPRYVTRD